MTESHIVKNKTAALFFSVIVFIFPITLISEKAFAIYTTTLSVFGVFLYFYSKNSNINSNKNKNKNKNGIIKYVFILVFVLFLGFLFENYKANYYNFVFEKMKPSESAFRMVLLAPLLLFTAKIEISKKAFSGGIICALILMFIFTLYLQTKVNYGRVFGKYGYENLYAYVQLILCALLVIMHKEISKKYITFALICALYTVLATGTRGGWLGIPLLGILILFLSLKRAVVDGFTAKTFLILLAKGALLCVLIYLFFGKQIVDRVSQTKDEISLIEESKGVQTSIGTRFELWRIAINLAKENIVFGDGWGAYRDRKKQLITEQKLPPVLGEHLDPHNIYLLVVAEHGILFGGFFLICIFLGPVFYLRAASLKLFQEGSYPILLFLIFAMIFLSSESVLHRFNGMHWFASFWFLLFGWMIRHATVKS